MKRIIAASGAFAAAIGGILWFLLLMSTAADTVLFSRNYPLLIGLNVVLALGMLGLVGWQLRTLWRDYQAQVFGARLKLRLMLMFGVIAVLPGALVYGVSVQFVTRSIESWFDVRVEKALESGVQLGRSALDSLLLDLGEKARGVAAARPCCDCAKKKVFSQWRSFPLAASCCRAQRLTCRACFLTCPASRS